MDESKRDNTSETSHYKVYYKNVTSVRTKEVKQVKVREFKVRFRKVR